MTQDIMQLADTYADRFYLERRYHNEESVYDRAAAHAALQSAVDALQAENARLKRDIDRQAIAFNTVADALNKAAPERDALAAENKELKLTIDVQAGSVEAVQEANNRLAARLKEMQPDDSDINQVHEANAQVRYAPIVYNTAPKALEPLADEELRDVLRTCPHDTVENLRVRWLYAKDFARAIEAAHGIGGKVC